MAHNLDMSIAGETETMKNQYRQGDVLLRRVENHPEDVRIENPDNGRVVLAYGEVTGHAHVIDAALAQMYSAGGKDFLEVRPGATLRHEEHDELKLDPGYYEVIRQREYEQQGWRRVAD